VPIYHFHSVAGELPVVPDIDLEAADDAEAIELVRLGCEPADCELWCGSRKVAVIPKDSSPALPLGRQLACHPPQAGPNRRHDARYP
jgi:hypothetical protein